MVDKNHPSKASNFFARFHLCRAPFWEILGPKQGNGRNTVSRVLFLKRELTEFCGKLGELGKKLGEFALAHKRLAGRNSLSSLPGTRSAPKNSLSRARCLKPYSPKPYSARPEKGGLKTRRFGWWLGTTLIDLRA